MTAAPRVSVILPTFNRASQLPKAVESVFGQTISPFEVFVVDDGSTDDTAAALHALTRDHPDWSDRLHIIRQDNQGKSVALNNAIPRVSGDWIAFNDSDDVWRPDKLETQFRALALFPDCSACFTDAMFTNNPRMRFTSFARARKVYPATFGRIANSPMFIADAPHGVFMQTVLLQTATMHKVGEFDPRFRVSQDTDFLFRLACVTPLCYVNRPLVDIDRSESRSHGLTSDFDRSTATRLLTLELIFEKWLNLADGDRRLRARILTQLASLRNELANHYLGENQLSSSREALRLALRTRPSLRLLAKYILLLSCPALVRERTPRRR